MDCKWITLMSCLILIGWANEVQGQINNTPTIGILAQRSSVVIKQYGQEYLMSEYVKYLEMAGASVVTIKGEQPKQYYVDIFNKINGVLIPGGGAGLNHSQYSRSSQIMFQLAKNANDKQDFFPIWGTCEGFQMMAVMAAQKYCLDNVDAENISLPLNLTADYKKSRLLGQAPPELIKILTQEPVTMNNHHYCVTKKTYKQLSSLNTFFRVMSTNKGRKGVEFVSTMEAYKYPFYATQWHPEKNIFTRDPTKNVTRTTNSRAVTQYMANFFVDEARKNFHTFSSNIEKASAVIENDHRVYIKPNFVENFFYNVTKY